MSWMRPGPPRGRRADDLGPRRRRFRPGPDVLEGRRLPATLPAGFTETLVAGGLAEPTAMELAPDGRIFVAQQDGQLRVIKNGQLLPAPFVRLAVDSVGERGLLGVAFDPGFAANGFVYVYYTVPGTPPHNRISRFTAAGDVAAPGSEVPILELDPLGPTNHNGGAIHFGADGKLYVGVGENAVAANAQSPNNLLGKVLRINADGTIPPDNPSIGTGRNRAIWALGLRNPFTFAVQPGTGRIFINDVGQGTWEEINDAAPGANYGWPATEGPTTDPRFAAPLSAYQHAPGSGVCAISGGTFYNPAVTQFPAEFAGDYFFADLCAGWIHRLDVSTRAVSDFASGISAPVDLKVDAGGNLYYLARGAGTTTGVLFRIQGPVTGQAPVVTGQPADQVAAVGQAATFSVTAAGTAPLFYQWQRNGASIPGATDPSLTLAPVAPGDLGARFRVVVANAFGSAVSREALLSPAPPAGETPAVTGQPDDRFALAGEAVTFSASASGTAPLFYQWQRNGASIPGATDPSLTLAPVAPGDLGARFRVVVANAFGSAVSREALLVGPSAYVQALYADILGRPADRGGLALFSLLLARGTTPEQVATQLISVPERAELEAVRTYQVVLGRAPSRAEIDGWVSSRAGGRSVTDLQATLLAGPEYLARQGGRPRGFLRGLYRDVLGRAPRRRELLVQMMRVRRAGREAAARGVLTSVEAWNRVAAGLSVALLGRAPRPAELAAWVGQLRAGLPRERLEVMLLSGPEYLARS